MLISPGDAVRSPSDSNDLCRPFSRCLTDAFFVDVIDIGFRPYACMHLRCRFDARYQQSTISGDNPTSGPDRSSFFSVHRRVVWSYFRKLEKNQINENLFFFKFWEMTGNNTPVHRNSAAPDRPGCGVIS